MTRLLIVGMGMMGGSIALAARAALPGVHITGCDPDAGAVGESRRRGLLDAGGDGLASLSGAVDIAIVASPPAAIATHVAELVRVDAARRITDIGSAKVAVIDGVRSALGGLPARFVPGHPIAGSERSGVRHAEGDRFRGRPVILTPTAETDPAAVEDVAAFWRLLGAGVECMDAARHDQMLARTSHLPHVVAFALMDLLSRDPDAETLFRHAGGGLRDFTRIAASSPTMWRDVLLQNSAAVDVALEQLIAELQGIRRAVHAADGPAVYSVVERARAARWRWIDGVGR